MRRLPHTLHDDRMRRSRQVLEAKRDAEEALKLKQGLSRAANQDPFGDP